MVMSTPRPPESGKERRSWEERPSSDTVRRTGSAEPSHPVDLTSLGADHIPHPATEHTPRGGPAAARPAPGSETDSDGHAGSLTHDNRSGPGRYQHGTTTAQPVQPTITTGMAPGGSVEHAGEIMPCPRVTSQRSRRSMQPCHPS